MATGDFLCLLYSTVLATSCNHTCIIQMLAVSINREMALMSCELLNSADFYFNLLCNKNTCNIEF